MEQFCTGANLDAWRTERTVPSQAASFSCTAADKHVHRFSPVFNLRRTLCGSRPAAAGRPGLCSQPHAKGQWQQGEPEPAV